MTMTAKFAGTCKRCGGRFLAGTQIEWKKGEGATHVAEPGKPCGSYAQPVPPQAGPVAVGSFSGVIALFEAAKAHLKYPKITLVCEGRKITLSVAGPQSKTPGSVNVVGEGRFPNRDWFGRVSPMGLWMPSRSGSAIMEPLTALLTEFATNPAQVAKQHGKLTGNCCFCNKTLGKGEDKRSIGVGFGPVCAEHFGLKDEWLKGAAEVDKLMEVA
jgi:Family of unknown function (DUF6011)